MKFRYLLTVIILSSIFQKGVAQVKSYSLKKGQAFDIIFISTKDSTEALQKKYFATAFPIAEKNGYKPLNGFAIDTLLQGNYHPEVMAWGTWESVELRKDFVDNIEKSVPDFHEMRRAIWSNFDMTFWEVTQDYSFEMNSDKFTVITAYWSNGDEVAFDTFRKKWLKQVEKSGGNKLIGFLKGESPFGYEYNPDFLSIVEWESKEDFDSFTNRSKAIDLEAVKHVNQFGIQ